MKLVKAIILDLNHHVLLTREHDGWSLPESKCETNLSSLQAIKNHISTILAMELPSHCGIDFIAKDTGKEVTLYTFIISQCSVEIPFKKEHTAYQTLQLMWVPLKKVMEKIENSTHKEEFYKSYTKTILADFKSPLLNLDVFFFGNSPLMAARLGHLVISGTKRATTGNLDLANKNGDTIPYPGLVSVVTDGFGFPLCCIETKKVIKVPFNQVREDVAIAEGEGDLSLEGWRDSHADYFIREASTFGESFSQNTMVFNEFFDVIHKIALKEYKSGE